MPDWLTAVDGGTVVSLHIQPRASKNEVIGEQDGALRCD